MGPLLILMQRQLSDWVWSLCQFACGDCLGIGCGPLSNFILKQLSIGRSPYANFAFYNKLAIGRGPFLNFHVAIG